MILKELREHLFLELSKAQKKERKKDVLFSAAKASSKTPSFEEVWDLIKDSDGAQTYVDSFSGDEGKQDEFAEETGFSHDDPEAKPNFEDWILESYVREVAEESYQNALYNAERSDGDECWRSMYLPATIDPAKHDGLGIFWSMSYDGADTYWGQKRSGDRLVTYKATVNADAVDKFNTILARCDLSIGEMEDEVTFLRHGRVFVNYVEYDDAPGGNGMVEIDAWRRV